MLDLDMEMDIDSFLLPGPIGAILHPDDPESRSHMPNPVSENVKLCSFSNPPISMFAGEEEQEHGALWSQSSSLSAYASSSSFESLSPEDVFSEQCEPATNMAQAPNYDDISFMIESMLTNNIGGFMPTEDQVLDAEEFSMEPSCFEQIQFNSNAESDKAPTDLSTPMQQMQEFFTSSNKRQRKESFDHDQIEEIPNFEQNSKGSLEVEDLMVFQEPPEESCISYDADVDSIRLVHLLLGGAEAVACDQADLANVILARLKDCSSRSGTTMQRIAAYFSDALQCRLHGLLFEKAGTHSYLEIVGAFHVLHEVCPYIKFGHFTANQAILEAVEGEKKVHIVDYDITDGVQWPSLMQSLALQNGGPPHLRITALYRPNTKGALSTTQETGKRLAEFANLFGIPFSFHQVKVDNESEEFRSSALKFAKGEVLVVNCMVHLPHMPYRTPDAVRFFVKAMHKLSPAVLTVVEEELSCATPTFTGHFSEVLHHYSTIFDSLEATVPSEHAMRSLVERVFLGPRIKSTITSAVSRIPSAKEIVNQVHFNEVPLNSRWSDIAESVGFQQRPLTSYNLCQAKLLVGLFKEGYQLRENDDRLLLCWKSKPVIAASAWSCKETGEQG